jgi:hypothetical protein
VRIVLRPDWGTGMTAVWGHRPAEHFVGDEEKCTTVMHAARPVTPLWASRCVDELMPREMRSLPRLRAEADGRFRESSPEGQFKPRGINMAIIVVVDDGVISAVAVQHQDDRLLTGQLFRMGVWVCVRDSQRR